MQKIRKLIVDFVGTDESIKEKIWKNNIQRIFFFSLIAVPVNIFHVVTFFLNLDKPGTLAYNWGVGIISCHFVSMIFFTVIGIIFYFQKKKNQINIKLIGNLFYSIFFFMLSMGVVIVSIDQMVTPAITPFLVFCIVISIILLIPPIISIPFFIVAYLLFWNGIAIFQHAHDIILSNRVNGLTAIAIGIVLSLILWKNTTTRYRQSKIIEEQKNELEKNLLELEVKSVELQKVNDSKDKLFSIIAHDLTSPFNIITGFSELMSENIGNFSSDEIERNISHIHKVSLQTQHLLLELLNWAKVQTGNVIFVPVKFDFLPICQRVVDAIEPIAAAKQLKIVVEVNVSMVVFGDKEMIKTVIRNLLSNAVKYSNQGGLITLSALTTGDSVTVAVKDEGVGIAQDKIGNIFSARFADSSPGTANETGSGLGLILCKEFVEKHGGKIGVESSPEKGTIFSFTLPMPS